ncbi:hypothetical protein TNCV_2970661 [Trichonephila clavipes]|nr:hypothetical protein TNCV_2970661 [Trichonephila clavipes]
MLDTQNIIRCFVTNTARSTVTSDQGPRHLSWQGASSTPVVRSFEHQTCDSTIWLGPPNLEGEHPGRSQRPPTSLLLPPTSREDNLTLFR